MPIRLGRGMRATLETVLDLQSQTELLSSLEIELFAHDYRKALIEMRNARRVAPANSSTLAAIKSAKSGKVTEVLFDEL